MNFNQAMFRATISALLAAAMMTGSVSAASRTGDTRMTPEAIRQKLQKSFDGITIEKIQPSDVWPGLYEVVTPTELAYTNADGSLLFAGKIIDAATKDDLTGRRWNQLNRININELPLDHAIKTVKGNGARTLYLFSDPDCPYCQALEKELKDVTDITIYTFLYPLETLHPQARDKANNIWCAADRAKVWSEWMLNRNLSYAGCEQQVVAENINMGARYRIDATPTLFFADGSRASGAMSKAELEAELARVK